MRMFDRKTIPAVIGIFVVCLVWGLSFVRGVEARGDALLRDYSEAVEQAKRDAKMLLIAFHEPNDSAPWEELMAQLESHPEGRERLARHKVVFVPIDLEMRAPESTTSDSESAIPAEAKPKRLLEHAAFAEMAQRPGLAVLDFTDPESRHFHHVVSVLPQDAGGVTPFQQALALLGLPNGSLTQRSLVLAVRIHPAQPQSTTGEFSSILTEETESHAQHQASINLQGHHQWEARFHRINAKLPGGLLAQEVCAESWPGQKLWESARECVHSWSQSPGHWSAVVGQHPMYSYDMKRGTNGVWYAAGIFGKKG